MTNAYLAILLCALFPVVIHAESHLPDSVWTFKKHDEHHHVEENEIWLSADRPGAGTGSEIIGRGVIQWETGFDVAHLLGMHMLTLPTTLFRLGVHPRIELRLEYTGTLAVIDHPDDNPQTQDEQLYIPDPLCVGAKFLLCDHHGGSLEQAWIPRTALMLNLGLPLTPEAAKILPVSGAVDLLFENEVTEWLSLGYCLGAHWNEWAPAPDIFATLGLNFAPTDHLGLFVESFNFFDTDAKKYDGANYTHYNINLDFGITYAVHPRVQLDAYAGFNLYNSEPSISSPSNCAFFGFGITWLIRHPRK